MRAVATPVAADIVPLVNMLPPVMLPVVEIVFDPNDDSNVTTLELPYVPVMPVNWLPLPRKKLPVTLPVALINPVVKKLPLDVLAVTVNELSVPTLVMLGWAAVVTVPAVVADVAVPALATVPVTLLPLTLVNVAPLPMK